jgi:predicted NUDIX family NTP pyrophosphohydrolase
MQEFPEVDRGAWFHIPEARKRILPAQIGFIEQLMAFLDIIKKSEPSAP